MNTFCEWPLEPLQGGNSNGYEHPVLWKGRE